MARRVAVVTDALSEKFIFANWYRYYGGLFGFSNLYVVTYNGLSVAFKHLRLGGLLELPVAYDDNTRVAVVTNLVDALLSCYDTVIRVDSDEFLVTDPRISPSLSVWLEGYGDVYATARGFDVIQLPDEESIPYDSSNVLALRSYAYPNSALNKTCISRIPLKWSTGFHWANVYPKFGPLFMLHMKRLDIQWQLKWFAHMSENIKDNINVDKIIKDYYQPDEEKIRAYHGGVSDRTRISGISSWYREEFLVRFLQEVSLRPKDGVYAGTYNHESVLCEIPPEWRLLI